MRSSYITDKKGTVIQHTEYIAFGEILFDEHSVSTKMPYLFNDYGVFSFKKTKNEHTARSAELDSETGLYYYGARYYDPRTSIWLNVDPLAEKTMTPYAYVNNNPVMLVDPDGRSGVPVIDKQNKIITVYSKFVFYGSSATTQLSKSTANEIASQYNGANGKITIDGIEYSVKFEITYQTVTEAEAIKMADGNTDASVNFIRVEKNNSRYNRSFNELGGNAGFFNTDDDLGKSTTAPHEVGHGYGLEHSADDQRGKGQPDIMSARGTLVDSKYQYDSKAVAGTKGGTVNPRTRKVTQGNITDMFKGVTFDESGKGQIGLLTNTIYDKNGYEKKQQYIIKCVS